MIISATLHISQLPLFSWTTGTASLSTPFLYRSRLKWAAKKKFYKIWEAEVKQQLFLLLKFRVGSVIIAAHTHCHRPADSPRWHEAAGGPDFLQLLLHLPGCCSPTASSAPARPFNFSSSWARSVFRFVLKVPDSPTNNLYYQSWKLGRNEKTMQILIHPYLSQHILAGSRLSFVFLILIPCFLPTCLSCRY